MQKMVAIQKMAWYILLVILYNSQDGSEKI